MNALLRLIPIILRYVVNIGPLVYEGVKWSIKIVREFKKKPPCKPEEKTLTEISPDKKMDPG